MNIQRITFAGADGNMLAARLDLPAGPVSAYAIFAHCFTCSKDIFAAKRISSELASRGIATLRFDFTGLGASEGEFANTNFSSNVADLEAAAQYLAGHYKAPEILVGHSLGGAAVLAVAGALDSVKAVATIGAPAEAAHVSHLFDHAIEEIERDGVADTTIGGRPFRVKKQFLEDIAGTRLKPKIGNLNAALMVLHSPIDKTVEIENASAIFRAAQHPKSFISLDDADHLLSRHSDAVYAAEVIAAWASRFVTPVETEAHTDPAHIVVAETGQGKFQNTVHVRGYHLLADEPEDVGGLGSGPAPYDYLAIALGACTSMTLRMYADFKKLDLGRISVAVDHGKVHASDCAECAEERKSAGGKVDRFERRISVENMPEGLEEKLLQIADKCPVHRTLEAGEGKGSVIVTKLVS